MHFLTLSTLIVTATTTPIFLSGRDSTTSNTTIIEDCEAAANCETYESNGYILTRIKPNMGPGSEYWASLQKRQNCPVETKVQYGQNSINYGESGASGVGGLIHHLYDVCGIQACDTNEFVIKSNVVDKSFGAYPYGPHEFALKATGWYGNGWDDRNAFVEIMVGAAAQGEECKDVTWVNPGNGPFSGPTPGGPARQCQQTNFLQAQRVRRCPGATPDVEAQMSIQVNAKEEDGWCGKIGGVLSGFNSAMSAIPEVSGTTAVASGLFGIFSAVCV